MNNFIFCNPVKIIFGKGFISKLDKEIPLDAHVMLLYGSGSIKKNGVYEAVKIALKNRPITEFNGIEANPDYNTLIKAVNLAKANSCTFLLAVGGGSVLDGTKFIAASIKFKGNPWDILTKQAQILEAVPLGAVLTLPATGSEMNAGAVISRRETQQKLAFGSIHVYPKFSILDPETTFSLTQNQIANGIVDAFAHVAEQYFTKENEGAIQDEFAEGIFRVLMEKGPLTLKYLDNYSYRADFMWAATMALNGLISAGVSNDWSSHLIGHELTAVTGMTHGETLAIILPTLLLVKKEQRLQKLAQFARKVLHYKTNNILDEAEHSLIKIRKFFINLGMKTYFSEYNYSNDMLKEIFNISNKLTYPLGNLADINLKDVTDILSICLKDK